MEIETARDLVSVALSCGVDIKARQGGFLSFSNSPYYSHRKGAAVDLYPRARQEDTFSPVDGVIVGKYSVRSPKTKFFIGEEREDLLLIRPDANQDVLVRILHIDSNLVVGSEIRVGESLGRSVKSGFFNFWTENHIHVEVRKPGEPLRAKGGLPMVPYSWNFVARGDPCDNIPEMKIVFSDNHYILIEVVTGKIQIGNLCGVGCRIGKQVGIMDVGLPHYTYGAVVIGAGEEVRKGDHVVLWGRDVGTILECSNGLAMFKSHVLEVKVNGQSIRGISFYPWLDRPLLKLVPHVPGRVPLLHPFSNKIAVNIRRISEV